MLLHRTSVDPQWNHGEGETGAQTSIGGSLLGGTGLWATLPNPANYNPPAEGTPNELFLFFAFATAKHPPPLPPPNARRYCRAD